MTLPSLVEGRGQKVCESERKRSLGEAGELCESRQGRKQEIWEFQSSGWAFRGCTSYSLRIWCLFAFSTCRVVNKTNIWKHPVNLQCSLLSKGTELVRDCSTSSHHSGKWDMPTSTYLQYLSVTTHWAYRFYQILRKEPHIPVSLLFTLRMINLRV